MLKIIYLIYLLAFIVKAQKILNTDDCNINYGCYKIPDNCVYQDCDYIIKWKDNNKATEFIVGTKALVSNFYMAIGFSYDRKMGNDCVVMCKYMQTSSPTIEHYFNPDDDKTSQVLDSKNRSIGLSNVNITLNNNFLTCSFMREKAISTKSKYFDLNKMYYLLIAKGYLDPQNEPTNHKKNKFSSSNQIDFKSNNSSNLSSVSFSFKKAHGTIMISTWIFLATFGIIFSRYLKNFDSNSSYFGLQPWFFFHRLIMISTMVFSIIGVGFIFYENNWKWTSSNATTNFIHSIFGIITIGLTVIQPLNAVFRPGKNDPNRSLFNCVHRSIGLLAYFFALISILLGLLIYFNDYKWTVVVGWIGWLSLVILLLELSDCKINKYKEKVSLIQNAENSIEASSKNSFFNEKFKRILIVGHLIVTIILVLFIQYFLTTQFDN